LSIWANWGAGIAIAEALNHLRDVTGKGGLKYLKEVLSQMKHTAALELIDNSSCSHLFD